MHPHLIITPWFNIPAYGFFVALGYLAAMFYINSQVKNIGPDADTVWGLLTVLILGALLGGKILYIAVYWKELGPTLGSKLLMALRDIRFGFIYFGGFIAALAAGAFYCRAKKMNFWHTADFFAPAIALGHGIGRIGCFMAGCCYGRPTMSGLGIAFHNPDSLVKTYYLGIPLYPVQLFEAAGNFIIFAILHYMLKSVSAGKIRTGSVILGYAVTYSLLRFLLEFLRGDDRGGFFLMMSPSQLVSLACFAGAVICYILINRKAS